MSLMLVDGAEASAEYTLMAKHSKLADTGGDMVVVELVEHGLAIVHKASLVTVCM
jgi:hypothetical protein